MESDPLNESFFDEILREHLKIGKVAILEVKKELVAGKGDNIKSEICRIVRYTTILEDASKKKEESVSLMVKLISPENIVLSSDMVSEMFRKEFTNSVDVASRIEKFVDHSLAPKFFYYNRNINLIMD